MKPRTYKTPSCTTVQNWDPLTWDALKARAKADGSPSLERTVYELVQWALLNRPLTAPASASDAPPLDVDASSFAAFRIRDQRDTSGQP